MILQNRVDYRLMNSRRDQDNLAQFTKTSWKESRHFSPQYNKLRYGELHVVYVPRMLCAPGLKLEGVTWC